MLSSENPPPDPPNTLTNKADDIDPPAARNKLPLGDQLDPGIGLHRSTFSIRDYVFTERSKDIRNNWPFSLKNLQLCLRHGVKDPLPPFQPLEAVKKQSLNRCSVERVTAPVEKQNTYEVLNNGDPSASNLHVIAESCNDAGLNHHEKAVGSVRNSGCEYENDRFFLSTTSLCQSEIDSAPISKSSSASAPLEAAGPCFKPQKHPAKKSRLIVKFGSPSERSSLEDLVSPSESMASKVCPVCKTFSSSSNTTLNAHIDQCLSAESTPKWTVDSKLSRHRIKPRKVKLMVDIYATAKTCTLEELDRRNGTSWAAGASSLAPNEDAEMFGTSNGGNDQRTASSSKPDSSDDVGAVYIDASGTKLRILSKSSDAMPTTLRSGEYFRPKMSPKGSKPSKLLPNKWKKRHRMKHQKYLNLALQSRKSFSHDGHGSKMVGNQEEHNDATQDNIWGDKHQAKKHTISSNLSRLRERTHLKRSCIPRKASDQDGSQPLTWKQHSSLNMQPHIDLSNSDDPFVEKNYVQNSKKLVTSSFSLHENSQRTKKSVCDGERNDQRVVSMCKKPRSPLVVSDSHDKVESFLPSKNNVSLLSKGGPHAQESHLLKPPKSQISSKQASLTAINYSRSPRTGNSISTSETSKHVFSSSSRPAMVVSMSNLVKSSSTKAKKDVHISEDEGVGAWHSKSDEKQFELTDDDDYDDDRCERYHTTKELSSGRGNIEGITERREALSVSDREGTDVSSSSPSGSHGYSHEDVRHTYSSRRNVVNIIGNTVSTDFGEVTATSLNRSAGTKFLKTKSTSLSRSNTLSSVNDYNESVCLEKMDDSPFADKQQMFCAEELAPALISQGVRTDMDSESVEANSFPEVDPIPIPGPPGSFLPSPRDIGSEDFQGNSSLTTSRVQSSQDQFDLVDGESSDSLVSAVSTISDPMALRSTQKDVKPPLSACSSDVQEKNRLTASNEQPVEDARLIILTEKMPFILKNDNQPCHCQRNERLSQGLSLNFQDSQLLRRRTMAPASPSPHEERVVSNINATASNLDLMPGTFPFGSSPRSYGSENSSITRPPLKGFSDGASKFAGSTDHDSASPSSSNPVLRLMGKNLVVNKDDSSGPVPPDQSHVQADHVITSQLSTSSGVSLSSNRNMDGQFLQHAHGQNPHFLAGQSFDPTLSDGFRQNVYTAARPKLAQLSAGTLTEPSVDRGFILPAAASVKLEGNHETANRNSRLRNKKGPIPPFNSKNFTNSDQRYRNAEIIVIDDAPENEARITSGADCMISSGFSAVTFPANPFPCYQSHESLPFGIPPGFQATSFNVVFPGRANASPAKWGCTVEKNPYVTASSSSRTKLRSSLPYYSPSSS